MSEGLQNKMYNYEVAPPSKVWEKIAAALDEPEAIHEFSSKLYGIEITPPAAAWERIKTSLDAEHEAAIPERRKLSPLLRYAAAAAIIGLITFGSIMLLKSKPGEKEFATQKVILSGKDTTLLTNENITASDNNTAVTDEARDDAALEASKQTFAKLDMPAKNRMKNFTDNYFTEPVNIADGNTLLNPEETYRELHYAGTMQAAIAHHETKDNLASRYIMLMTPDGNIIRMSKKLSTLVCCVSGEDQDADCKDQLQRWREKIACAPGTHSPGNFMDILSLVSSLQDNNQ